MPKGHNFTTCGLCGKEYVCGDCITNGCEMGHAKRSCPGYKTYLRGEAAAAAFARKNFDSQNKQVGGASRMLADYHLDNLAKEMTDAELADALLQDVWANLEIGSRPGAIVAEIIERLRRSAAKPNAKVTDPATHEG